MSEIFKTLGGKTLDELPQIPTELSATGLTGTIDISWKNNNTNVIGTTNVSQLFDSGEWVDKTEVASGVTTTSITGLSTADWNVRIAVKDGLRLYPSRVITEATLPTSRPATAARFDLSTSISYNRTSNTNEKFSIAGWARFRSGTVSLINQLLGIGLTPGFGYDTNQFFPGTIALKSNAWWASTINTYGNDIWHFIAIVGDNSTALSKLYVYDETGNIEITDITGVNNIGLQWDSQSNITFGAPYNNPDTGYGDLSSVGTWSKGLAAQNVADLWNGGDGLSYAHLTGDLASDIEFWYDFKDSMTPNENHVITTERQNNGTVTYVAV